MSREIKFRAYYKPEYTMLDWEFLQTELNHYNKPFVDTDDYKVMQYTGLKDRHGVEIYEGDIILVNAGQTTNMGYPDAPHESIECTGQVSFGRTGFYISGLRGVWPHSEDTEVIGNIYETPELLNANN